MCSTLLLHYWRTPGFAWPVLMKFAFVPSLIRLQAQAFPFLCPPNAAVCTSFSESWVPAAKATRRRRVPDRMPRVAHAGTDSPIQRVLKQRRGQVLSMIVVMPHSCAIAATGSKSWTSNRIDVGDSRTITVVVDRISSVTPSSIPSPKTVQRYRPPRRLPWS